MAPTILVPGVVGGAAEAGRGAWGRERVDAASWARERRWEEDKGVAERRALMG